METKATVTIQYTIGDGWACDLSLAADTTAGDVADVITASAKAVKVLAERGAKPAGVVSVSANGNGASANGSAPVCKFHGPMKPSTKQPGGYFCPSKMGDGSYCKEKA